MTAMWAALAPAATVGLVFVALLGAFLTFVCEAGLAGFRADPDPARVAVACGYIRLAKIAGFLLFASVILLVVILGVRTYEGGDDLRSTVIVAWLALAAISYIRVPIYAMFGAYRRPLPLESVPVHGAARLPSFAAALSPDDEPDDFDTFRVFIAPTMLCGAGVKNKVGEADGDFTVNYHSPIYLDARFYDKFDVTSPGFGLLNADNFQIALRDIAGIDCDPVSKRKRIIDAPNSGSITLKLKSGATRELIVLGKRDVAALRDELQRIVDWAGDPPVHGGANP